MSDIMPYPLTWPQYRPRTLPNDRVCASFGKRKPNSTGNYMTKVRLSLAEARTRMLGELDKFNRVGHAYRVPPQSVVISSNLHVRTTDGLPRGGQPAPKDPGVALYFKLDGQQKCIACDTYNRVEDNMAGIAATIEALRAIERHGSGMFNDATKGFSLELPSPDTINLGRGWREVLDYYGNSETEARLAYRRKCKETHPDAGGSDAAFDEVQKAWADAEDHFKFRT